MEKVYLEKKRKFNKSQNRISNNKKVQFYSKKIEDIIYTYREKKAKEIFENKFKKEKDKLKQFNIIKKIIELDDVEEEYIFYFIKLYKEFNLKLNSNELKNLIIRLSEKHYYELNLTSDFTYINHKKIYIEELDLISSYNTHDNFESLIKILESKNKGNKKYFSVINKELEVNMPITFKKNENLMYFLIRDFIINSFIERKDNNEYLTMKIIFIENNIELLKSISKLSEKEQNLILFILISLTERNNIENCILKFQNSSIQELFVERKNNLKIEFGALTGTINYNNTTKKVKILNINLFHLISLFYQMNLSINTHKFYFNKINEMYNDIILLKCVKIEYMNKFNYYSNDIEDLKTIIFEIVSSKAMDEYIDKYTDYISDVNILKNRKFFDYFWENNINFIPFERNEGFQAESLRAFCIINFSSLPLLSYNDYQGIEISLFRLLNYTHFVVGLLHEFEGHLNKMILWLYNKSIQVKTIECPNDINYINYSFNIREEDDAGKLFNVINDNNKTKLKKDLKVEDEEWRKKIEGGYNFENTFFNFIISDIITINQMLFILNSNNYQSLKNTNFFPYLYISYRNSLKESKIHPEYFKYLKLENVSNSFKNLLNKYNINEIFSFKSR